MIFVLGAIGSAVSRQSAGLIAAPAFTTFAALMGVCLVALAWSMRLGKRDTRTALTVFGAITLIGIWPFVFVVPAIVFQYRPESAAWLRAVGAR